MTMSEAKKKTTGGTIAQNRRATLVEHDGIDPKTAALSLCTRIDPVLVERPA